MFWPHIAAVFLCLSADDIFCTMHQVPPRFSTGRPPPPTSPMIAPVSLPAGVQLRANLYDPSILKTWLAHYNIHSLFWSHIDDVMFSVEKKLCLGYE